MDLYLQFGWGMMDHTRELLTQWQGGGVILSPRDLNEKSVRKFGEEIAAAGHSVLLDPQCYQRDQDHKGLVTHDYWQEYKRKSTADFSGNGGARDLIASLRQLNKDAGCTGLILPGLLATEVTGEWLALHRAIVSEGVAQVGEAMAFATVALSEKAMLSEEQVEAVVDEAETWRCETIYLVCETPGPYLVSDPNWMANLLLLSSGLKLAGKRVLVGYSNHQTLVLAAARVDAIASGTWLNVRAFQPDKFYSPDEEKVSRRAVWYYCPQALSEYKLTYLDIAKRTGVLPSMRSAQELGSNYADALFGVATPTNVDWKEPSAFRHYLTCLHGQCVSAPAASFELALQGQRTLLNSAKGVLATLSAAGVVGQERDFKDAIDANNSALAVFEKARGPQMRQWWK